MHFILIYGLIMLQIMQYVLQIIVVIYSYFEKNDEGSQITLNNNVKKKDETI